ncbi:MAG: hypothetical protein JXB38_08205 [Anaerolineales bacterium]|nr:hypothetical protein [Anaerolineales bacterium]
MNSRQRFLETMSYGCPDRVPYFEEGIRRDVLDAWHAQGLPKGEGIVDLFPTDKRLEIQPDVYPSPQPDPWPTTIKDLDGFRRRLKPSLSTRLPLGWRKTARQSRERGEVIMLRVHQGFFQTLGVDASRRFTQINYLLYDDPAFIHAMLELQGKFTARLTGKILHTVKVDAVIFSEAIGDNHGALISPQMYREFVLPHYQPLMQVLREHGVEVVILRTYANARALVPAMLEGGFNCLWASEVNVAAMDYGDLRREFGRDLRLIGGIDLDALRNGKDAIKRELEEKVPPLLADGVYIPLADGRVRAEVPYECYCYYRELLQEIIEG